LARGGFVTKTPDYEGWIFLDFGGIGGMTRDFLPAYSVSRFAYAIGWS
jgi:hypothetical protein